MLNFLFKHFEKYLSKILARLFALIPIYIIILEVLKYLGGINISPFWLWLPIATIVFPVALVILFHLLFILFDRLLTIDYKNKKSS